VHKILAQLQVVNLPVVRCELTYLVNFCTGDDGILHVRRAVALASFEIICASIPTFSSSPILQELLRHGQLECYFSAIYSSSGLGSQIPTPIPIQVHTIFILPTFWQAFALANLNLILIFFPVGGSVGLADEAIPLNHLKPYH
jgi:hypothetical protein